MASEQSRTLIWDWTIRVFHWSLVLLVAGMWWTAEQGWMFWHKWLGLALVGLLAYRLVWGLIGPAPARLMPLVPRPHTLVAYIRKLSERPYQASFGHNPLGGLSVLALLGLLLVQLGSGLISVDVDGLVSGWFGHLVSFDMGRAAAEFHETSFNVLLGFIILHLIAILAYTMVLRANLIGPMVTGRRSDEQTPEPEFDAGASLLRACTAIGAGVLAAVLVLWFGR